MIFKADVGVRAKTVNGKLAVAVYSFTFDADKMASDDEVRAMAKMISLHKYGLRPGYLDVNACNDMGNWFTGMPVMIDYREHHSHPLVQRQESDDCSSGAHGGSFPRHGSWWFGPIALAAALIIYWVMTSA